MKTKLAMGIVAVSIAVTGCSKTSEGATSTTTKNIPTTKLDQTYISAGSIICSGIYSFFKVRAVEMARNPYAILPSDCDTVGADIEVNVLRVISSPGLGDMALIGNSGGTAYVRMTDVKK